MKLSELVKIRRSVAGISPEDYERPLQENLKEVTNSLDQKDKLSTILVKDIAGCLEKINNEFDNIRTFLDDYKLYIESCIQQQEKEYFDLSNQLYQDGYDDDAAYILNRRHNSQSFADHQVKQLFITRLGMYNSWKYPAIEIRPAFGEFTDLIKGCDPLYLLDTDENLFCEVKQKWSELYQNRLRYYTFNESDQESFNQLPNEQFGLIVSVDYFNFKPIDIIEKLLDEFYKKLRPGGVIVFTYNNCDFPYAVKNVENKFCCYTPGTLVQQKAKNIGYQIIKSFNQLDNVSWLEIRKPGKLLSLRGGQSLGEIRSFN